MPYVSWYGGLMQQGKYKKGRVSVPWCCLDDFQRRWDNTLALLGDLLSGGGAEHGRQALQDKGWGHAGERLWKNVVGRKPWCNMSFLSTFQQ